MLDTQKLKRDALKSLLAPLLRWDPLHSPREGFSIVLGVPWALRHLLPVNLLFVRATDLANLHRLHIVFDRIEQPGSEAFVDEIRKRFPDLPLTFRFHPPLAGHIAGRIDQSKFYASMNWTLGLGQCETRYAVLHDFDLYPLVPHYFSGIVDAMRKRALRFSGAELTDFDGLEASHRLIGTWSLGIDVAWLRSEFRPIDCFHAIEHIDCRRFDLDAFTFIQSSTPARDLAETVTEQSMAHVRNLCSTYLRFSKGEHFDVVWRLHHLRYLESLCSEEDHLTRLVHLMETGTSARLDFGANVADFSRTHVTCASVLRAELFRMDKFLHGQPRAEVASYVDAFERFLWRFGRSEQLVDSEGSIRWSPTARRQDA